MNYFSIFLSCVLLRFKLNSTVTKYDLIFAQEYTGAFLPKVNGLYNFHHICQSSLNAACNLKINTLGRVVLALQKKMLEYFSVNDRNVIAVSKRVGVELSGHKPKNLSILNNCIPSNAFVFDNECRKLGRKKLNIKDTENVALYAGRSDRVWKGVDLLDFILKQNWSNEYTWLILSDININIINRPNVHVIENVPHEDMAIYYQIADCALFLSRYEGDSYYLIEALVAGLHVCTFDAGTALELIEKCNLNDMYLGARSDDLLVDSIKVRNNLNDFVLSKKLFDSDRRESISKSCQRERSVESWEKYLNNICYLED